MKGRSRRVGSRRRLWKCGWYYRIDASGDQFCELVSRTLNTRAPGTTVVPPVEVDMELSFDDAPPVEGDDLALSFEFDGL